MLGVWAGRNREEEPTTVERLNPDSLWKMFMGAEVLIGGKRVTTVYGNQNSAGLPI